MRILAIIAALLISAQAASAFEMRPGGAFRSLVLAFTDEIPAPITVIDLEDGGLTSLSQYEGKVAVVTIWATWCHVCAIEMPVINEYAASFKDENIAFLPVSIDEAPAMELVVKHLRAEGLANLPAMVDRDQALARRIGVRGTPTTLIVDKFGQLVAAFEGQAPWESDEMRAYLEALAAAEDAATSRGLLSAAAG